MSVAALALDPVGAPSSVRSSLAQERPLTVLVCVCVRRSLRGISARELPPDKGCEYARVHLPLDVCGDVCMRRCGSLDVCVPRLTLACE